MKHHGIILISSALSLILQPATAGNPAKSGIYTFEQENLEGSISIAFNEEGKLWFSALVVREDGHTAQLTPEDGAWIPMNGNKFSYNVKDKYYDYLLEGEFISDEELELEDNYLAGGSPFGMGVGLGGYYRRDGATFADTRGYMYSFVDEATRVLLAQGGRYSGIVEVPDVVRYEGEDYPVAGIGDRAFSGNLDVTEVRMGAKDQYIIPGAFWMSGIPYDWESLTLPGYVYPDKDLFAFVSPNGKGEEYDYEMDNWLIFKQNCGPLHFVRDNTKDENAKWGCFYTDPDRAQGIHYELRTLDVLRKQMFRGYTSYEIIALAADSQFAAFHNFPSFSRWKHPEPEVPMDLVFEEELASMFGRKVMYSRRVAELREANRGFGMVEFEHTDNEAMVAFAWMDYGTITATYTIKQKIDPEEEYSIWNVDLEEYGTPEVISIALDPQDNPIIWINHSAPESKNIFGLRKVGDKLVPFGEDQWYVAYD